MTFKWFGTCIRQIVENLARFEDEFDGIKANHDSILFDEEGQKSSEFKKFDPLKPSELLGKLAKAKPVFLDICGSIIKELEDLEIRFGDGIGEFVNLKSLYSPESSVQKTDVRVVAKDSQHDPLKYCIKDSLRVIW